MRKQLYILVFLLLLTGCDTKETLQGFSMDAPYSISVEKSDKQALKSADEYLKNADKIFSAYLENSTLSKLNKEKEIILDMTLEYNADFYDIIKIAKEHSNDVFDPTIRPISKLWDFKNEPTLPLDDDIKKNLKKVSFENIVLEGNKISLKNDCEIELGAIAKGYVCDKVSDILKNQNAIIDVGGTVKTTTKEPIKIGIKSPDLNGLLGSLELPPNKAVSTSGSYERNFTIDGKMYHHILNPKNGYPTESDLIAVSVIGESATVCDILSTSFFALGLEKSLEIIDENTEAIFVTTKNKVVLTKGIKNFNLINKNYMN